MRSLPIPLISCVPLLLALLSCGAPPKPPTVDPSERHPVNTGTAVDLQACLNDLYNTRILAAESGRAADMTSATLSRLIAQHRAYMALRSAEKPSTVGNSIYTVRFQFGSSHVEIPAPAGQALLTQARNAPLILLRGRTDGTSDSAGESQIARERAWSVRDYLVAGGIDPARIRATYQPAGDQIADNSNAAGRSLNRRVEIELYRALPIPLDARTATP